MERETLKIILPVSKYEVTIKKWLTGQERMAVNNILIVSSGLNPADLGKGVKDIKMTAEVLEKWQNETLKQYLMEIKNEKGEKIKEDDLINVILELHEDDWSACVDQVNQLSGTETENQKK